MNQDESRENKVEVLRGPVTIFGSPFAILIPLWLCPMCGEVIKRDDPFSYTECGEREKLAEART